MRALSLLIGILLLATVGTAQQIGDIPDCTSRDDVTVILNREGNAISIKKLQWFSPHGELPGTYQEYLAKHPLTSARFSEPLLIDDNADTRSEDISILVDASLYSSIIFRLNQYMSDLNREGYSVHLEAISGGTPEEIKTWVRDRNDLGCSRFVFVGDITAAWAEVSGSVFPCDLYYMDLDGSWVDADINGVYESHSSGIGDMGPEVYVGRIYAHTLDYDSEASMVNGYFTKAHSYREGELTQEWHGLEYVEEDWFNMNVNLDLAYGEDVTRYDYGFYTTGADYLNQMDLGQHFVQVCAHSYSGGHHFGTRPTESAAYANVYVYSPLSREARLLLGSDDGIKVWMNGDNVYTNDKYGGWIEDQFMVDVSLNAGWNRLLCKVSQEGGDYGFSARFTDTYGISLGDLKYQMNNPVSFGEEAEFIRGWLINGFHEDISDNFWNYLGTNYLGVPEGSINPNSGEVMGGKTWTIYLSGSEYIDLSDYDDHDYGASYAFTRIQADSAISCELWMGYDDGARVWLNGTQILDDNRYGGFEGDMTKIDVSLNPGENRLLVKISEWMGSNGFSARFSKPDGTIVDGLTFEIDPGPIAHICGWLVNGPYINPDQSTRLSQDYLGDEATVAPSSGDVAPLGTWERGLRDGRPFMLGEFYDRGGDWVYSETIQERDPPVLFYNLFSCGPGRFTDDNYLAGAYIFNTSYGLITVASAKSGSMLNFYDFTQPLGQNKSFGEAYLEWFDAQAPYELWEQEWYYGMVLNGDPTLRLILDQVLCGDADASGDVDIDDAVHLINYIFAGGPPPDPIDAGDADCSGDVDIDDVVYLISYIFSGGNPPCDNNGDGSPDC